MNIIDTSITPDPFNPKSGDAYTRTCLPSATGPRSIVVHDIHESGNVRMLIDGGPLFTCMPQQMFLHMLAREDAATK